MRQQWPSVSTSASGLRRSEDELLDTSRSRATDMSTAASPKHAPDMPSTEQIELAPTLSEPAPASDGAAAAPPAGGYRVYKRRWFGLVQLVLLNIIVSWDWLTYSPVVNTAAAFFDKDPSTVNWLATAFLLAFVVTSPVTFYTVHKHGPKGAIMAAAALLLVGNWVRYGGTRASPPNFGVVMFGQILIGFAQPFVLAVPTSYSDLWFTPRGRVSATAFASLANAFGAALGQLIDPFLAVNPPDIPPMTLYVAIISSVACIPSFFIPARPPTPVAPSSTHLRPPIREQLSMLSRSLIFWLIFVAFTVYVGLFNSFSSLLTQILTPYQYSQNDAGIAGAVLILVGLVTAAVASPIIDRYKHYLLVIRILVPIIGVSYMAFYWAPPARTDVAPYIICAILGASSFSILPVILEWQVEITWPVLPALSSTICWTGGQVVGAIIIIISEALEDGPDANPPFNLQKALIFQAVLAMVVVPITFVFPWLGKIENKRMIIDQGQVRA